MAIGKFGMVAELLLYVFSLNLTGSSHICNLNDRLVNSQQLLSHVNTTASSTSDLEGMLNTKLS